MPTIERSSILTTTTQLYKIFLSHAGDIFVASAFAEKVRQIGGEVWLDIYELAGGDPICSKILKAIDGCDEAIVILSPKSLSSKWVMFEMGAVCGQHKRITPILDHIGPEAIPFLPEVKGVDINQADQLFFPGLSQRIAMKTSSKPRPDRCGRYRQS